MKSNIIKKQNLFVLLLFIIGVVASIYYLRQPDGLTADEELSVQEVVLRHLFENNDSSSQQNANYYFVGIKGSDPSEKLLRKFEGHNPKVLAESKASFSEDLVGEVRHQSNGKQGIVFTLRKIETRQDGKVYVEAKYFEASLSSGNYQFLLEFKNNNWQIIAKELTSVS